MRMSWPCHRAGPTPIPSAQPCLAAAMFALQPMHYFVCRLFMDSGSSAGDAEVAVLVADLLSVDRSHTRSLVPKLHKLYCAAPDASQIPPLKLLRQPKVWVSYPAPCYVSWHCSAPHPRLPPGVHLTPDNRWCSGCMSLTVLSMPCQGIVMARFQVVVRVMPKCSNS